MNSKSLSLSVALYVNMDALNILMLIFFATVEVMVQILFPLFI